MKKGREKWAMSLVLLLASASLVFGAPAPVAPLDDDAITSAIETQLQLDEGVSGHLLDVSIRDGVVTLSGVADHLLAKDRAVTLAKSVKGVRAVIDQMIVNPVRRSDEQIRADVTRVLEEDPLLSAEQLEVDVTGSTVTLSGSVPSWFHKQLAERLAKRVAGIESIENEIGHGYRKGRADEQIERDIAHRLEWNPWINENVLDVRVSDGRVTVSGSVGSADQINRIYAASWVPGVEDVDTSEIEVVPAMARPVRKKGACTEISSEEIEKAIERTFALDPRVSSYKPRVAVKENVVTLSGVVQNLHAKQAAEGDASNTVCVRRVKNHLKVRPRVMDSDAVLTRNVEAALERSPYLNGLDISVSVGNSRAILGGGVDTFWQKKMASIAASSVPGIVEVSNRLFVHKNRWRPYKEDQAIEEDIEDQLFWSPAVDSESVAVSVEDGIATLSGTVTSFSERRTAAENAYQGGAREVRNDLVVSSQ